LEAVLLVPGLGKGCSIIRLRKTLGDKWPGLTIGVSQPLRGELVGFPVALLSGLLAWGNNSLLMLYL